MKPLHFRSLTKGAVMPIQHLGYVKSVDINRIPGRALKVKDPQKAQTVKAYPCD
jgi:hypothetical protein